MIVLVTTYPFNKSKILEENNEVVYNCTGKYNKSQLIDKIINHKPDVIIAGTEKYDKEILDLCPNLKLISRVGIGTDSIDLDECEKRNIKIAKTDIDLQTPVAELVVGQIISLLRCTKTSNNNIKNGSWKKIIGRQLNECNVGIIGYGKIGKKVENLLKNFNPKNIFIYDKLYENTSKEQLIANSDVITIHLNLTSSTKNFISKKEFSLMKNNSCLVNFSRGEIVNEKDLFDWLVKNPEASAAIDTFSKEPYFGGLCKLDNILLTPHIGTHTKKCRQNMEIKAVENVLKILE